MGPTSGWFGVTDPLEASVGRCAEVLLDTAPSRGADYIMPGLARDMRHEDLIDPTQNRVKREAAHRGGEGIAVDYVGHFRREVAAFEAAGRAAVGSEAAPIVPSCPGWVMTDLVLHLGMVHRLVAHVIGERMQQPPEAVDRSWLGLTKEWRDWLPPGRAPQRSPVPAGLLGWFHAGAADL